MPTNRRNSIGNHARNAVSELQMEAQTIGSQAQQRAHELSDMACQRASGVKHQIEDRITQNPLKAVLIAAGLGMVFGILWRR